MGSRRRERRRRGGHAPDRCSSTTAATSARTATSSGTTPTSGSGSGRRHLQHCLVSHQSGAGDQISWGALGSIYGYIGVDATTQYPVIRAASGKGLSFRVGGSSTELDDGCLWRQRRDRDDVPGPQSALHVYGSSDPTIDIQSSANNGAMVNYIQPSRTLNLGMNSTGDFSLNDATAGLTRLFLKASNGALGIGNYGWSTYNPVNSLDVSGAMSVGYGLSPSTAHRATASIVKSATWGSGRRRQVILLR